MYKNTFPAIALFLVLLFSGCMGGATSETSTTEISVRQVTPGIVVTDFSSYPTVDAGDTTDLNLIVQNMGDVVAKDIWVDIYQHGSFQNTTPWTQVIGDLSPPDPATGLEGESYAAYWTVIAPKVPETQFRSVMGRVHYTYTTTATTNVYLVGKDEWLEQGADAFSTYSTASIGPMTMELLPLPAIRINQPVDEKTVSLNLIFKNTGDGKVDGDLYGFEIKVDGLDITQQTSCANYGTYGIKLFGLEGERSIRCDVPLSYPGGAVSHIIEAKIDYKYYSDTPALTIEVNKV